MTKQHTANDKDFRATPLSTSDIAIVLGECTSGHLDINRPPATRPNLSGANEERAEKKVAGVGKGGDSTCYRRSRTDTHLNTVEVILYISRLILGSDCLSVSADRKRRFDGEVGCGNRVRYNNRKRRSDHQTRDEHGLPHLVTTQSTKGTTAQDV